MTNLRARARASSSTDSAVIERHFIRKYQLPTTHDAYLRRSEAEWAQEMFADWFYDLQGVLASIEAIPELGLNAKAREAERRRLFAEASRLSRLLGEPEPREHVDPVLDDIEAAAQRGEQVDLSALLPPGYKPPK